jgi:predicted alpha/beta-fold hydrolase
MKRKALLKLAQYPQLYDREHLLASTTLRAFDNLITAPLHGYRDTDDYWTRASAKPVLGSIEVPALLLNARNDPFLLGDALPGMHQVSPRVECEFPLTGGHVGFITGRFPGSFAWFSKRIIAFADKHSGQTA